MSKPFNGNFPVSGQFGATGGAYGKSVHQGVDFALPLNTPVIAANGGRVARTGQQSAAGKFIVIAVGNREELYFHLNSINVAVGQNVSTGQVIGYSGSTGNSTGPHLHFEVRVGGKAINPTPYWQNTAQQAPPVVNQGGGWYKAIRVANVRAGASTSAQNYPNRQLQPGHTFKFIKVVEGERVTQNGVTSNLWALSEKNGYVWVGNLIRI